MNYLQLVARLKRKCRVTGAAPASIENATSEEVNRLMDWINEAWMDIPETRQDWEWMRGSCSFTTVAGQAIYTPAEAGVTDFGNWTRDTWRIYTTSVGMPSEQFLIYRDYESWRNLYQFGSMRTSQTQPVDLTITPEKSIGLGPLPTAGYTVIGDYFKLPTEMSLNADTPALPGRFHMLIVYRAMMFYGVSEAAPEVYEEGKTEFNRMMSRVTENNLPELMATGEFA